jgi:hypothetical protein
MIEMTNYKAELGKATLKAIKINISPLALHSSGVERGN